MPPVRTPTRLPLDRADLETLVRTGKVPPRNTGPLYPPPTRLALACVHEGAILEFCPTCQGESKHVRDCDLHDRCTRAGDAGRTCATCDDYLPAGSHPNIVAADAFRRKLPVYPEGKYGGRGVVICGGGKYWASTYVTVRMLRHVGCTLPVQVWYLGARERNDRYTALLAPFGVDVVDMLAHPEAAKTRGLTGWNGNSPFEGKSFAVLHSPFEEVLSLDSDNYPCVDPTTLFDELRYVAAGGAYWPDGAHTERWTRWEQWGVERHGPEMGFEVGQYVIDKRKAWGPLNLARWYDDHGDWCYGGSGIHHDHGDKGPWRVGWAAFKMAPATYTTKVKWDQIAFVQPGPDGVTPWFIHRCRSKIVLKETRFPSTTQTGTNIRAGLPGESDAFRFLDELRIALCREPA